VRLTQAVMILLNLTEILIWASYKTADYHGQLRLLH